MSSRVERLDERADHGRKHLHHIERCALAPAELHRDHQQGALSWIGFGNSTSGVWLSPHPERLAEAEQVINDLDLAGSMLTFTGQALPLGLRTDDIVHRAWALDDVAEVYRELLDQYRDARPAAGDSTLFAHVELVGHLQRLPFLDPQLPDELLPSRIGRSAIAMIQRRRAEWYETAQLRWLQVAAATSPA